MTSHYRRVSSNPVSLSGALSLTIHTITILSILHAALPRAFGAPTPKPTPPPPSPPKPQPNLFIPSNGADPSVLGFTVIKKFPHDMTAFTEGLFYINENRQGATGTGTGTLYESTGLNGRSTLRRVDLMTGKVLKSTSVPSNIFAEGIARSGNLVYQLRYQTQVGTIFNFTSLQPLGTFTHPMTDGWGLAALNSSMFVGSDGTSRLYFMKPGPKFTVQSSVVVQDNGVPIKNINELEVVNGQIWANIWLTTCIAVIDPATGKVVAWMDAGSLRSIAQAKYNPVANNFMAMDVLNGIAWDSTSKRLLVTGKFWPYMFHIRPRVKSGGPNGSTVLSQMRKKCRS